METIKKGDTNKYVKYLQFSLVSLGYYIGPSGIDSNFGDGTENAVFQFQCDNNLKQDGIVGIVTWNKIIQKISVIQSKLIEKGYDVGERGADGIYGNSIIEAVKKFQRNNGLKKDGIAGQNTRNALYYRNSIKNDVNISLDDFALAAIKTYIELKRNKNVRNIQNALYTLGYNIGPSVIDGKFGEKTKEALIRFHLTLVSPPVVV